MKAVVLAAGEGIRLRPLTLNKPIIANGTIISINIIPRILVDIENFTFNHPFLFKLYRLIYIVSLYDVMGI